MPTYDDLPGWELRGEPAPHSEQYDREAERLRALRAQEARERRALIEKRRARTSVPPPRPGPYR